MVAVYVAYKQVDAAKNEFSESIYIEEKRQRNQAKLVNRIL